MTNNNDTTGNGLEIAVIGGTGGVGTHFVELALERGHKLTLLARTPYNLHRLQHFNQQPRKNLTIIEGDATNLEDVQSLMSPSTDVLVSMAGNSDKATVMREAMAKNILAVAPKRAIVVTTLGMNGTSRTLRQLLSWTLGKHVMNDVEVCDTMLCHEPNVTVVRPDGMCEQTPGNGRYNLTMKGGMGTGNLAKADVALCLVDLVEDSQYDGMGGVQLYRSK
ncbi:MAG: hypothetical protein SGILL_010524 [Bacillariaceae sp.]